MKGLEIVNWLIKNYEEGVKIFSDKLKLSKNHFEKCVNKPFLEKNKELLECAKQLKQELERKEKLEEVVEILRPIICIGENIEEGGNEYWLASDRRLFHLTKEQYELINEVLSK